MSHRGRRRKASGCSTAQDTGHSSTVLRQCPKAGSFKFVQGKKSFWRRHPWLIWLIPVVGLFSLVWFLIRVVPKPSRASYPCQRLAAPLASGFVIWAAGLLTSTLAYRKARQFVGRRRYVSEGYLQPQPL